MSPSYWGPYVWLFIHGLAATINTTGYEILKYQLYNIIHRIMFLLPCPECAQDSVKMLSLVKMQSTTTKQDFVNMLYLLHNQVNAKLKKPLFNSVYIPQYEKVDIIQCYNKFVTVYSTTSVRLINDNMHRKIFVNQIKTWLIGNIQYFRNHSSPIPSISPVISDHMPTVSTEVSTEVSNDIATVSSDQIHSFTQPIYLEDVELEPVGISEETLQDGMDNSTTNISNQETICILETLTSFFGGEVGEAREGGESTETEMSSLVTPLTSQPTVIKRRGRQKKQTIS